MKLSTREALAFIARPDPGVAAVLISGEDVSQVAERRADLLANLLGPGAEAEMRLTRIAPGDLRGDPAALNDALRASGFFPGARAVVVDPATDSLAEAVAAALADWRRGDAVLVASAGDLKPKGALRKLFESAPQAVAITLYDDPPGPDEIAAQCRKAGLANVAPAAQAALADLARALDTGAFRRLVETLGLYKHRDATPLTVDEVAALAPPLPESESDALFDAVAGGQAERIAAMLVRLRMAGVAPTRLCIDGLRHFRLVLALASDPEGASAAAGRARPPLPFRRRDGLIRQAQSLGADRAERAIAILLDTDLALRSSTRAPEEALVERALIRVATLAQNKQGQPGR